MASNSRSTADVSTLKTLSEHEQAAALWTFVHLKTPRFTSATALEVVRQLASKPGEDAKALAKRLRKTMLEHGVALKHTAAIEAAARLLGNESWHGIQGDEPKPRLKLTSMLGDETFLNWADLTSRLTDLCDQALPQMASNIFELQFGRTYFSCKVEAPGQNENGDSTGMVPLLSVSPLVDPEHWLSEAPRALEALRRYFEESGQALLDGYAVLQFCHNDEAMRAEEACNTELVLMREDDETAPGSGYEIARGDELTCWSQLELATKDKGSLSIDVVEGAWVTNHGRYVWEMSTLRPKGHTAGVSLRVLGQADASKLLRRYRLARRFYPNGLAYRPVSKRLEYLGTMRENYNVSLDRLRREMQKVGLTWEAFCTELGREQELSPVLPVWVVIRLVQRLELQDPNVLFARPTRTELARVDDDVLLRALTSRVDHVTYRVPRSMDAAAQEAVRDAVADFGASLQVKQFSDSGNVSPTPLPHLVYSDDADTLRLTLAEQGLVMFAGVMPRLVTSSGIDLPKDMPPIAIGNSLYLDIDFAEGERA